MAPDPNQDANRKCSTGAVWEQRFREAGARAEEELRTLIAYLNNEVVPEVRKNGSVALRKAAQQMEKLAQKMDDRARSEGK